MAKADNSKQIAAMKKLGMTDEEIKECLQADDDIDHGAKLFELSKEQEEASRKARKMGVRKAPTIYKLDNTGGKRSRKENPTKAAIIAELAKFLQENSENACENVEITNKERMIAFVCGENSYELTLVQKRKPKK